MIDKLKKVKITDLFMLFMMIFIIPIGLILKLYNKIRKKPIWLICEIKDTCRDNGYVFFKYMMENHSEINCYYAIDKKCSDYKHIEKYDKNIIDFSSLKHYIYYIAAKWNISSHKEGNPNHSIFTLFHLYFKLFNNRVFLQHGITKDNIPMFYYKNTYFKRFICGAKPEFEYLKENFGYPKENLIYTGFARFDELHNININKNQIVIIPTWRKWFEFYDIKDKEKFKQTQYFNKWNNLLNNESLNKFAEKNNLQILLYLHYHIQKFSDCFRSNSKHIKIVSPNEMHIQNILKDSAVLITDYSSVFMDFAYMKKPLIYYHFDYDKYRNTHLKEGYFDYTTSGFGEICTNEEDVIDEIVSIYNNNCKMQEKYIERADKFFEIYDNKNCERIYQNLVEE